MNLSDEMYRYTYGVVRKYQYPSDDARQIVAEAVVVGLKNYDPLRGNLFPYLSLVVRDHLRRNWPAYARTADELVSDIPTSDHSIEDRLGILRALEHGVLSDKHRKIVEYFLAHPEKTLKDISRVFGLSRQGVAYVMKKASRSINRWMYQ